MKLEDFLNKHVIITLKDGEMLEGILTNIYDYEDKLDSLYYTTIQIRINEDEYTSLGLIEIDKIGIVK